MSNGVIKNCAAGICCPPPRQEQALAVVVKEEIEAAGLTTAIPAARRPELYLAIAKGLLSRGLIGVTDAKERKHLASLGSPTDEELAL